MESFGEILKITRERKGVDLDEAERVTSIYRPHIEALEAEDVDSLPGEPYIIGYLRNYSEFLGLDPTRMIRLYQAKRIQESPVPEALLKDIKPKNNIPIIVLIIAFFVVALSVIPFIVKITKTKNDANIVLTADNKGKHYDITTVPITKRIYEGDTIGFNLNDKQTTIKVHETHTALALDTPVGILYAELGDETSFDLNGDKIDDVVIFVSDISKTDSATGAEVRMFLKSEGELKTITETVDEQSIPLEHQIESRAVTAKNVLFEGGRAYPFTINASFRGACLYRYQCDNKEYIEDYYTSGDVVVMQAQNGIRVWISNAINVKMQVIGDGKTVDVEVGRPGQVLVQDIKWIKDSDGRYKLVVLEVD
ncbi:MAG: helix-turn-helix domain-containing protein [Treponema sp.]|nr:helix-turn-helix domain-containing protein [Treponema sp.]